MVACVNPPAFTYVVVGCYLSYLGPLIASAWWSSSPWHWAGFAGVGLRWGDPSALLLVVSTLCILLALALLVFLPLDSPPTPPSRVRVACPPPPPPPCRLALRLLLALPAPPPRLVPSPPPPRLDPPCYLTRPLPDPSSVSPLLLLFVIVSPSGFAHRRRRCLRPFVGWVSPSSSLPGPYVDRD